MTESLFDLWVRLGKETDKFFYHSYLETYDSLLSPLRDAPISLLELGVWEGGSLRLWQSYFTCANIQGIDLVTCQGAVGLNGLMLGDATDPAMISSLGRFDVIIDDASHSVDDQIKSFQLLLPHLNDPGLYFIEDVTGDESVAKLVNTAVFEVLDFSKKSGHGDDILLVHKR